MNTLETTMPVPLTLTKYGTIRISGSQVSLDSIVHHYKLGATAEQIAQKFPSLSLADIYATIAYYLNQREAIEEYLRQQEAEADALQQHLESDPQYQTAMTEMRERLLARWATQQPETIPSATD